MTGDDMTTDRMTADVMSADPVRADVLPYQYVVLRAVPRVEREEFMNVGIVLFCQAVDLLQARWHLDHARLQAFAPALDLAQLEQMCHIVDDVCAGREGGGRPRLATLGARFGWLAAPRSTILQPGPRHGGTTCDPLAEIERLCGVIVR